MAETRRISEEMSTKGQELVFSNPFHSSDYFLIEVDKQLADDVISGKEKLVVRGNLHEHVTFCTENQTFATKEVEISKTMLITENLEQGESDGYKIVSLHNTYIELKPTKMPLFHLKKILSEMLDEYDFEEPEPALKLITYQDLLNTIQLSEGELKDALEKLPIIEENGFLNMLSARACNKILDDVIKLCNDDLYDDITIQNMSYEALRDPLSEKIPGSAILWFLREFCDMEAEHCTLNEDKVCRSRSEMLLREKPDTWEFTKFLYVIQKLIPTGFTFKLDHLKGLCLFGETTMKGKTIQFYDSKELSMEPKKRLQELFKVKSTWSFEDVEPFLVDICDGKTSVEEILAKFCFCSKKEGRKFYTLKVT